MAKGLFSALKGIDAFGKVCTEAHLTSVIQYSQLGLQTSEDVKIKTRTGALGKWNNVKA